MAIEKKTKTEEKKRVVAKKESVKKIVKKKNKKSTKAEKKETEKAGKKKVTKKTIKKTKTLKKSHRFLKVLFIIASILLIAIPLINTNFSGLGISDQEKRKLAGVPEFYDEDGRYNENFTFDFEKYVNDNIGLRNDFIWFDAGTLYSIFKTAPKYTRFVFGPNGELNYITDETLREYQGTNLFSKKSLDRVVNAYKTINERAKSIGSQFYYLQNWDKESIYDNEYSENIIKQSEISRTDQKVKALKDAGINVISCKEELIKNRDKYLLYPKWGDVLHYTDRGAFLTYQNIMRELNARNNNKYKVLTLDDYNIEKTKERVYAYGGVYEDIEIEKFKIKNPKAYQTDEKTQFYDTKGLEYKEFYQNDTVNNNDTLLIYGDSYMVYFLFDDLAESFHRVIMTSGVRSGLALSWFIDTYRPNVIINEFAERQDMSEAICIGLEEEEKQRQRNEKETTVISPANNNGIEAEKEEETEAKEDIKEN